MKKTKTSIKLDSIARFDGGVGGFATGRNGWRFEFTVSRGMVDVDRRENEDSSALDDARQIKRELKTIFMDVYMDIAD